MLMWILSNPTDAFQSYEPQSIIVHERKAEQPLPFPAYEQTKKPHHQPKKAQNSYEANSKISPEMSKTTRHRRVA